MNARRTVSAALAATLMLTAAAPALAQYGRPAGPVELTVVDRDRGYTLPQYGHRGQAWVPGAPGHRYAVRLSNRSPERVLVVLSVDGVNAVSGQTAHPEQAGYVLEPWQTTEVAGWRKSTRDVAQFYFSDMRDSYAARTGRPHHVGVIGIAVFDEARRLPPPRTYDPYRDAPYREGARDGVATESAPASPASAPPMAGARAQSIGTGHGVREYSPVSRTGFVKASPRPIQVTELRYDDERALVARGIVPRGGRYSRHEPRAFPGGFVPDPRW